MSSESEYESLFMQCEQLEHVDLKTFSRHYLPTTAPTDAEIDACTASLISCGRFPWLFDATQSRLSPDSNNELLSQSLKGITDNISTTVSMLRHSATEEQGRHNELQHELVLRSCPSAENMFSSLGSESQKLDGYFYPATANQDVTNFYNVAVCVKVKERLSEETSWIRQREMVCAASQVMDDDPRRRFMYGMLIEGNHCKMIYVCRKHVAISRSFDWLYDYRLLISIILSFTFGSPSDLGYDPKVTIAISDPHLWLFEIPGSDGTHHYYRTRHSEPQYSNLTITGKSTRVWEVQEVKSSEHNTLVDDQIYVLKEVWLDEDAETDKEIQDELFEDIRDLKHRLEDNPDSPEFESLEESHKDRIIRLLQEDEVFRQHFLTIESEYRGEVLAASKPLSYPERYTRIFPYRVVFKELCVIPHDLDRLTDILTAFDGALDALSIMFAAGWVHRDVSSANVLFYMPSMGNARGILSDLEYARPFPSDQRSRVPDAELRTGTVFFMPEEIVRGEYMTKLLLIYGSDEAESDPEEDAGARYARIRADSKKLCRLPPMQHNFAHDLESFWWMFTHTILHYTHDALPPNATFIFITSLFTDYPATPPSLRYQALTDSVYIRHQLELYLDPTLRSLAIGVDEVRAALMHVYKFVDTPTTRDETYTKYKQSVSHMYSTCFSLLQSARETPYISYESTCTTS